MSAITFLGNTSGGAINGGNVTLTYPASARGVNNVIICTVTLGTSKTTTLAVASSSGAAFTQSVATLQSSSVRFGVFRRMTVSSLETACTITGSGGSTDATAGCLHIFDVVDLQTNEDTTATSTTGSGTAPDSPSITVVSCGDAILSCIGLGIVSAPTAPSSFLNSVAGTGSDTHPATAAAAWITSNSTAAFNPTAWTSTSATWISATVALRREYQFPPAITTGTQSAASLVAESKRVVVRSY